MEQVRSRALDNLCEGLGDARDTMNRAKVDEQSLIQSALQTMQQKGITVYKHARVELARVPGAEKLRVRIVKEDGDAGAEDLAPADEGVIDEGGEAEAAADADAIH